ncbi:GntR family transcriptional regulator [Nakamurella sp. PAMC28650]|uniref:GntR family transcriptional regulator n=1 Tax=Nakamurella sp. PAMC28650 TaxID=2762325 RepID=UPI002106878C|nr:GntR family transcriptional regulator [Nakamurella sp. PAMC28650]
MPATRRTSPLIGRLHCDADTHSQAAILAELRRVILEGGVPPGTPIPVDQVAETFGVSRIPVRESLRTLIGEGLVDHRPHAGYLVAQLTVEEFQGLYTVRGVLEKAALSCAVGQATRLDDEAAMDALTALDKAMRDNDYRGYHVQSRRFHLALVTPSRMRPLLGMLESAWNVTEPFQPMARIEDDHRRLLHAEHRAMLDHFLARDAEALLAVASVHLDHLDTSIAAMPAGHGLFTESERRTEPPAAVGSHRPDGMDT